MILLVLYGRARGRLEGEIAPETVANIRDSVAAQGLMATFDARLDRVEQVQDSSVAEVHPAFSQQQGYAHSAMVFALGDSAEGYAALSLLPAES